MGISFWQIGIVIVIVVLLFGRGKISDLMGDVAKGINSFKKGMREGDDTPADPEPKVIEQNAEEPMAEKKAEKEKAE